MDRFRLNDLIWIYNLERRNLSVFVKNSDGTRAKNIMDGTIYDIPTYRGEYGSVERRLDFEKILGTKNYTVYFFKDLIGRVGTKAFTTLAKEARRVEKEQDRLRKDTNYCEYSEYDYPEIDASQYMLDSDIIAATRKAEAILQKDPSIKKREEECKYNDSYQF